MVTLTSEYQSPCDPAKPIHTPVRKLRAICIGAGASGLLFAYKIQRHFDDFELAVYEKNKEISGTWYENRYPGCACDIMAHSYNYSFAPKWDWTKVYAGSEEIFKYFNDFADEHNLRKYIHVEHQVVGAEWDEDNGIWHVETKNLQTGEVKSDWGHVLLNATGILNNWKWPSIPGFEKYKKPKVHSARWDPNIDLKGKTVGLIGNGSSAIQILPEILPDVKNVVNFIREPTWVSVPLGNSPQHVYSEEEKQKFKEDPEALLQYRKVAEQHMNSMFQVFMTGSEMQKQFRDNMVAQMTQRLNNKDLQWLVPDWALGCRRLTPGPNYLESLTNEKVEIIHGGIAEITEDSLIVSDKEGNKREVEVDVLICATGFDTSFCPRFPIVGRDGRNMQKEWAKDPEGYFGLSATGYPNYFISLGPNCPIGNGPVICAVEAQIQFMIDLLQKYQKENIKTFDVRPEAVRSYNDFADAYMGQTVWNEPCRSWYKAGTTKGRVTALYPGSALHFIEVLANRRWEDFSFSYVGNRFDFLGNGLSTAEAITRDLDSYIRTEDTSPLDPSVKPSAWKIKQ